MGIQINGNTNNINAGIGSLSIEDINELDIVGVATASNFKTGISNLHDVGLTLTGGQIDVGSNIKIGTAGVITATSFVGSGANLTGLTVPGGATNLDLLDSSGTGNGRVRLGASQDLQIYHDGSHSWMANDTGRLIVQTDGDQLQLRGDTIKLFNGAGNSTYASVDTNNHLLYTAGLERFRIYNDGVVAIGQSSKSSTVGAGGLDIQGNGTNCILEMGNPFPGFSGGVVPEFRITATLSSHEVKFESIWGGDNALHPHMAFTGGRTHFYKATNSDEIARFDSDKFFIGQTTGSSRLCVSDTNPVIAELHHSDGGTNDEARLMLGALTANPPSNRGAGIAAVNNGAGHDLTVKCSASHSHGPGERVRFKSNGDVSILDGNLIVAAGHGIDFSSTGQGGSSSSMQNELLADYEEGTWVPVAHNFTISSTYHANYTRIGRTVHITMWVQTASGSSGAPFYIAGLPYTVKTGNVYQYACGRLGSNSYTNSQSDIVFEFTTGNTTIFPKVQDGGMNWGMASGTHVMITGTYIT